MCFLLLLLVHTLLFIEAYGITISAQYDHLVILSHGIMGSQTDLNYLSSLLEKNGCKVLKSKANEKFKSINGIVIGGQLLAKEILTYKADMPNLKKISFVGNSLGGLYARSAIKELFNSKTGLIGGLQPLNFMTIATPHLGVRNYTFLDEWGIKIPTSLKLLVSNIMSATGQDLFLNDNNDISKTVLFRMATEDEYLKPLKSFTKRRLYANIINDFVVPLGTAAFLINDKTLNIRNQYISKYGIVYIDKESLNASCSDNNYQQQLSNTNNDLNKMILSLDSCGWEKVYVNFNSILPLAHNKICALNKYPKWFNNLLGFQEGRFVMENATEWLIS